MKVEKEEKEITLYSDVLKENITTWIQQDIVLPDTKPDAIKIVTVNVNPYITQIDVKNESIKVNFRLNYFVIYKANETDMGIRGILTSDVYTETLNVKNVTQDMIANIEPKVKNVIFALPNERKISVKTEIVFKVVANSITKVPLIEKFNNIDDIQIKKKEETFDNILENKCDTISSREDIILPEENSDFGEILKVNTDIINTEFKQSYNKLLVKGDIILKMLYMPENNENIIKKAEVTLPFTGMIEFSNIKDTSMFDVKYNLKDFNVRPNLDITSNKTLNVDYQVALCALMYEKENVSYIDDFYSQSKNLKYTSKNSRVIKSINNISKTIDIKENIENALLKDYVVIDYDVDTSYLIVKQDLNELDITGNLKLTVLSQNKNTQDVESKTLDIAVSEKLDLSEINDNAMIKVNLKPENLSIDQKGKNINVKVTLLLDINVSNVMDVEYIEDIDEEDLNLQNLDSMIIYIVKPKDTLWSIAKKYKTTVEKIATINNIENPDLILEGQKLLIIR